MDMLVSDDFEDLCNSLNDHGVEYVIVGGYALAFHGAPRYTSDLDVLVGPELDNVRRLVAALSAFGFPPAGITAEDIAAGGRVLQMGLPPTQVHVMTDVTGVTWSEVWKGSIVGRYGRCATRFIGRAEFLKNKRAAGRPKDLADIDTLESL